MRNRVVITEDGSKTIYVPSLDEHYHSTHGAIQESRHIFINSGLKKVAAREINIFELGFGTGLNAFLTVLETQDKNIKVSYSSIEKYPVPFEKIRELNYPELIDAEKRPLFDLLHSCDWNSYIEITDKFSLRKIQADIKNYSHDHKYDLVYFDAFGADKQPGMWTADIISGIAGACNPGAVFVTYSARGELKRQLKCEGFNVEHPSGPPGKREITRALKS